MSKLKISVLAGLYSLMMFVGSSVFVQAAQPSKDSDSSKSTPAPPPNAVVVNGQQAFLIPASLGRFSAAQRAKSASARITKLESDPKFDPNSIDTSDSGNSTDIMSGDIIITSVTDADGKAANLTHQALADQDAGKLTSVLVAQKAKQSVQGALQAASPQNIQESILSLLFQPLTVRVFIFVLGFFVASMVGDFFHRWVGRYVADSSKRFAMNKLVTIGVYCTAVLFASIVFQETLGNLAVVLGAAAAGIAFALQSLIVSLAGWAAITFGDYLKIGDRVEISGIKGDVLDIGFIRTTLMEVGQWINGDFYTGRIVRIGNSYVFNNPVYNYSGAFGFIWDELTIPVKSESADVGKVRNLLQKIAEGVVEPYINQAETEWTHFSDQYLVGKIEIHPVVTLEASADKLQFTIRYVVDYRDRRKTKDLLYSRILEEFAKSDGKLALASA
jgi:small-conductance mechanosensitive channel